MLGQLDEDEMAIVRARTALLLSIASLRSRLQQQLGSTREASASALGPRLGKDPAAMDVQVLAAACAGALAVAIETWAATQQDLALRVNPADRVPDLSRQNT